ncbi:uncharacterized protein CANTADRAFT_48554 [Suhomyces tanzawaensis NRRL Y-17324]|uniref:FAS1 domain-containing protein n=1 Tax=Suhomyces tanzawaensis NRRL Y-17324 TaxID=984487 RepID=A0A1E4SLT8_9ASCO|nr:uncharacterized protein CANTADRAFT_48554 [Suhomyces tanzawaensis NRRL Y-17324]ODV80367.1 hypothetical protein CANTADRAFT_48554 [Suhomyces tanzawaensis NRRL Y-17324]
MNLKLVLSLTAVASVVAAKNVVNFDQYEDSPNEKRMDFEKREPKNIADLSQFKEDLASEKETREAKYIFDLEQLKQDLESQNGKRDAKYIVDLEQLRQDLEAQKDKRDAKYISFDITAFKQAHGSSNKDNLAQIYFTVDSKDCHANLLESILPQVKLVSIFAGYVRDYEEISHKTELTNETMLVIAPSDEAIDSKLNGLKPWEFPISLDSADNEDVAVKQNLELFVNHHVVLNFEQNLDIDESAHSVVAKLNSGDVVTIKQDKISDKFSISLANGEWINVERVQQVDNGFLFVINDVLDKP